MSGQVPLLQQIYTEAKAFVTANYPGLTTVNKNLAIQETIKQIIDLMKYTFAHDAFEYVKAHYPPP